MATTRRPAAQAPGKRAGQPRKAATATALPSVVNVLVINPLDERALARVKAVAPKRLHVVQAYGDFFDELWSSAPAALRDLAPRVPPPPAMTPAEREATLAAAHVVFLSFPVPPGLLARATNVRWIHFPFAGASNLKDTPYWRAPIAITTNRGGSSTEPIGEYAIAAIMLLAKGFDVAVRNNTAKDYARTSYPVMRMLRAGTVGIIGLGGIGSEVARLARALGMRVVATRRSATRRQADTGGVDMLYPPAQLHGMLAACDYVVVAAMHTAETEGMVNEAAFAAMKQGAYLINIARGKIVDEQALIAALRSGKLAGACTDVYGDDYLDLANPPNPELTALPNVFVTPHVSGRAEGSWNLALDLFCRNLDRFLKSEPLENQIDWDRGY